MFRSCKFSNKLTAVVALAFSIFALIMGASNISVARAQAHAPAQGVGSGAVRGSSLSMTRAYEAAWLRQPEAQSIGALQAAAEERQRAADAFIAAPIALGLSTKSDRLNQNQGSNELELGATVPLWWPGERARAGALAHAEGVAVVARVNAAQLRTAALVRDAVWAWQRAQLDAELTQDRARAAQTLASDVAKRVAAGELARADQHQADMIVNMAQSSVIESSGALQTAALQLRLLIGTVPSEKSADLVSAWREATPDRAAKATALALASHPEVLELAARVEIARRNTDLAKVQQDSNPELSIATTRERASFVEPYRQSITIGMRLPFGSSAHNRAKAAVASAEFLELEVQANAVRDRVAANIDAAHQRLERLQQQQKIATQRAHLANESRGFVDKAFRAGEADLPARLRVERDAADAESSAARAQIDVAAGISALRQALGLLPN